MCYAFKKRPELNTLVKETQTISAVFNQCDVSRRSLDKEMRAWDTYTGVENTVKNMLTSLRAVSELQNPAIRERHWQQLMAATKVTVTRYICAVFVVLYLWNSVMGYMIFVVIK